MNETYHGNVANPRQMTTRGRPYLKSGKAAQKRAIVSLVERGGSVRSFHVEHADKSTINLIAVRNVAKETRIHTDESRLYTDMAENFSEHHKIKHFAGEYVRGDVHTNTVENVFSVFKRGMKGTYQHCAEKHLHRYLAEFDFRYNNRIALGVTDFIRADNLLMGVVGIDKLTATRQFSCLPTCPQYCRVTPTEFLPFFTNPVSSTIFPIQGCRIFSSTKSPT